MRVLTQDEYIVPMVVIIELFISQVMFSQRVCVITLCLLVIKFEIANLSIAPVECLKPFCQCQKKVNEKAVCSGRSLHYIPKLPKYIRSVTFTNTSIRFINKGGLVNLTFHQIEKINFTGYALRSIDKDAFFNIPFLKSLIVSSEPHLNITFLNLSFQSLTKLKIYELDFNFNLWKSLPRDMFNNYHVSNVKHLILQGNSFTYINFTTFKTMSGLKEISIANNEISHVTLTRLTSLIILDMSSNLLPKVPIFCGRNDTSYFPN